MKEHIFVDNCEQKECSKCEVYKDIALFNKDKTKKDGLYSCCKKCSSIKDKATYNKDPEKKKAKTKAMLNYIKKTINDLTILNIIKQKQLNVKKEPETLDVECLKKMQIKTT